MTNRQAFDDAFAKCPLIAILRGVKPDEVEAIGDALIVAGFTILEVPMNSPDPLDSIARPSNRRASRAMLSSG
ncbi:MAG: 2-dehydro-3-deoxy-6-phosphogalactonate aldolase, partial [Sphingomonas sp.]